MSADEVPPGELADEDDELGWDRTVHGRMRDQDTDDDEIQTEPWSPT